MDADQIFGGIYKAVARVWAREASNHPLRAMCGLISCLDRAKLANFDTT